MPPPSSLPSPHEINSPPSVPFSPIRARTQKPLFDRHLPDPESGVRPGPYHFCEEITGWPKGRIQLGDDWYANWNQTESYLDFLFEKRISGEDVR